MKLYCIIINFILFMDVFLILIILHYIILYYIKSYYIKLYIYITIQNAQFLTSPTKNVSCLSIFSSYPP